MRPKIEGRICEYCNGYIDPFTRRNARFCCDYCRIMSWREKNSLKNQTKTLQAVTEHPTDLECFIKDKMCKGVPLKLITILCKKKLGVDVDEIAEVYAKLLERGGF